MRGPGRRGMHGLSPARGNARRRYLRQVRRRRAPRGGGLFRRLTSWAAAPGSWRVSVLDQPPTTTPSSASIWSSKQARPRAALTAFPTPSCHLWPTSEGSEHRCALLSSFRRRDDGARSATLWWLTIVARLPKGEFFREGKRPSTSLGAGFCTYGVRVRLPTSLLCVEWASSVWALCGGGPVFLAPPPAGRAPCAGRTLETPRRRLSGTSCAQEQDGPAAALPFEFFRFVWARPPARASPAVSPEGGAGLDRRGIVGRPVYAGRSSLRQMMNTLLYPF